MKYYLNSIIKIIILIEIFILNTFDAKIEKINERFFDIKNNIDWVEISARQNPFLDWIAGIIGRPPIPPTPPSPPSEPITNCRPCTCGITNKETRIVGGHETLVNQYPWMAMLMYSGRFYCGASLINDRYVLTAAHCINGFNPDYVTIRLLEHNRTNSNPNKIDRKIGKVIKHAAYDVSTFNNDIALLQFDKHVNFKGLLRPVCLPTPFRSFSGETGIVTGWGSTKESGITSDTLQEVDVRILSNDECKKTNYGTNRITDNMLCAGDMKGGKDSCQGDSGGPLHVKNNNIHMISGVVSWGEGCAQINYPGVYTRVNRFNTWIRSNTRDGCYCS